MVQIPVQNHVAFAGCRQLDESLFRARHPYLGYRPRTTIKPLPQTIQSGDSVFHRRQSVVGGCRLPVFEHDPRGNPRVHFVVGLLSQRNPRADSLQQQCTQGLVAGQQLSTCIPH